MTTARFIVAALLLASIQASSQAESLDCEEAPFSLKTVTSVEVVPSAPGMAIRLCGIRWTTVENVPIQVLSGFRTVMPCDTNTYRLTRVLFLDDYNRATEFYEPMIGHGVCVRALRAGTVDGVLWFTRRPSP